MSLWSMGSAPSGSFSSSMASSRCCWARSGCRLTSQATISLDPMSYMGARYALPPAALNSVTSVPSFTHGRSAAKVAFQQVRRLRARIAWYELYLRYGFGRAYGALQSHAAHNPEHALMTHTHAELVYEAHAHLPVAAPVGRAMEDLGDHRLDIRPGDRLGMRKEIVVGASRQSRDFQQAPERMAEPRQRRDDHRLLPVVGFDASRRGLFPDTRPSP